MIASPPIMETLKTDLLFRTEFDVVPVPGRGDTFQVRARSIPLHAMASLTISEAAGELRLSVRTVQRLCDDGSLAHFRPAKRDRKILRRDLDQYKRDHGIP